MEGMVNDAIIQDLTANNLLPNCQHSLRKGRWIDINLLNAYNYITQLIDKEVSLDFVFSLARLRHLGSFLIVD